MLYNIRPGSIAGKNHSKLYVNSFIQNYQEYGSFTFYERRGIVCKPIPIERCEIVSQTHSNEICEIVCRTIPTIYARSGENPFLLRDVRLWVKHIPTWGSQDPGPYL